MIRAKLARKAKAVLSVLLATVLACTAANADVAETLTVDEAVREALEHNLSLLAARHGAEVARADVIEARMRENPELSIESEFLSTRARRTGDTEYAMGVHFDVGGPRRRGLRIDVAERTAAVADLELADEVRQLVLEVQSAAVDVMLAQANLDLARENLAAIETILEVSEARHRAGDIDGGELARTRLAARQFHNDLRAQELALANARETLRLLLGRNGSQPAVTVGGGFRAEPAVPAMEQLLEQALQQRPDLRAAEQEAERAALDARLQQARRRGEFSVGTELRRLHNDGNYLGLFVSVPLPLFDRNQGEIARASAERRQAETLSSALRARIENEIQMGYAELTLARELARGIDAEMLEDARRVREITETAYRQGEASLLEVLDANMAFNKTMEAYNEARADEARALYLLDSLSGATQFP